MSEVVKVPAIGLGTFLSKDEEQLKVAIKTAIDSGYKLIDTASIYQNEAMIGRILKELEVKRKEIFITTKVWNDVATYDEAIKAVEESLENLQTDYLDLVLIHWPKNKVRNQEVYRALEDLLEAGKIKLIGVSNFMIHHLEELLLTAKVIPMMNQVELHPFLQQWPLYEYATEKGIALTSYGPFAKGEAFNCQELQDIAKKHNVSVGQVVVKWLNQRKIFAIPKSITPERIKTNIKIDDFYLDQEDMKNIRGLNQAKRFYPSPDNIDF